MALRGIPGPNESAALFKLGLAAFGVPAEPEALDISDGHISETSDANPDAADRVAADKPASRSANGTSSARATQP